MSDEALDTLERRIKDDRVDSEIQMRNECTVCMDEQSCVVLVPCGHQGFCVTCAKRHPRVPALSRACNKAN